MRNAARSTFKDMKVGQSAEPCCSSDEFHPLSAAWTKRWRRLAIVSVFVAHKRNSVFEPLAKWDRYIAGELLRGYGEMAERLIFGNRRPAFIDMYRSKFTWVEGGQTAFAKRHGVDRVLVNMILNGKRSVSDAIAKALGLHKVYVAE
jgi:hypothetical protein